MARQVVRSGAEGQVQEHVRGREAIISPAPALPTALGVTRRQPAMPRDQGGQRAWTGREGEGEPRKTELRPRKGISGALRGRKGLPWSEGLAGPGSVG